MDDYDVVIDALQKHKDKLWEMTNRNLTSEYMELNVMDDIRFYQIEQLDAAIATRKNKKEWVGLTEEDIQGLHYQIKTKGMGVYSTEDIYRAIEAKLKEKNT